MKTLDPSSIMRPIDSDDQREAERKNRARGFRLSPSRVLHDLSFAPCFAICLFLILLHFNLREGLVSAGLSVGNRISCHRLSPLWNVKSGQANSR
ncbi:hypothetical protein BDV23DRAFT_153865 [Aspergillus alliaceus]|uniref:Uncharacterized protein n=1 Tax=Petromyces alliaceus TaxID=209559 RepID=A0A5N7CAL5_PETAA|nr:hypothetical protein BDV23DRAFT_153865 [Aspergillus alliaceus]